MPFAENDGVRIHYEERGEGTPLVFLHEFLNDHTGWEDQLRHFGRDYRCIAIAARGYPPSDAPEAEDAYSQAHFTADVVAVLDHLDIEKAHLVGLSMGSYTALDVALSQPDRVMSIVAASGASGGHEPARTAFEEQARDSAAQLEKLDAMPGEAMASGPSRIQLRRKDPAGWARVVEIISRRPVHSAVNTLRKVQIGRVPVYARGEELRAMKTPVLLMVGDEDESCLDVNLYLKRIMDSAQLVVLPASGHVLHMEEPALFNALAERFIASVERGSWRPRAAEARSAHCAAAVGLAGLSAGSR